MSKIDKLMVSGIRSFNHLTRESIQFETPLTLIVGYNGSGKTTIIECLKYATTGELPPNSKGGAFIHDPNLTGDKEILAQVKLQFSRTDSDAKFIVNRNIQLTVKKTTRSQKTIEGSLVTIQNGERTTVSSRVVQLDTQVPDKLGVSAAILDAVIFCHQDESLWPMSEPAALKKRFDEIFEAQKYTKAIDNLKVLRKKQGEKLTRFKEREVQYKHLKERAEQSERNQQQLEDKMNDTREKYNSFNADIEDAERMRDEITQQANSHQAIVNNLQNKRQHLEYREGTSEELRQSIEELEDDDKQLQESLEQYDQRVHNLQEQKDENTKHYAELQDDLSRQRESLGVKLSEQGKHQSDKEKYERQLGSHVEMIKDAARTHGIRGFDGDLDDRQVQAFNDRIQKLLSDKKKELEVLQRQNSDELDKKTSVITDLEGRKSAHTQDRVFAKQRIGTIEKRVTSVQNEMNTLEADEGARAILESTRADLEQRLQKSNEDYQAAEFDGKIKEDNGHMSQLESEAEKLNGELVECTRLATDRAQLDLRKKELSELKRKLDTLVNTWNDKLSTAIGSSWKPDTIEREFHDAVKEKLRVEEEATKKRDASIQELRKVQYTLADVRERFKKQEEESEQCKISVLAVLSRLGEKDNPSVDDLPSLIEELEEDCLSFEKELELFDAMKQFWLTCQKSMQKNNKCHLCDRAFDVDKERTHLADKIKKRLTEEKKEEVRIDLEAAQEKLGQLKKVRPQYDTYQRNTRELPGLDQQIKTAKAQEDFIVKKLEGEDQIVKERKGERQDLESMGKTVMNISQVHRDLGESEAKVERIMSQQQSSASIRSPDEIHELQSATAEQIRSVKARISKLSSDKQRAKDLISTMELEKSELNHKISNAVRQLEKKKSYQDQIQDLRDQLSHQRELIRTADQDLESIEPQIAEARALRDDTLQRGRGRENKAAEERDGLAGSVSELRLVQADIEDYIARGGPSQLASNERAVSGLQATISRLETELTELTRQTNKMQKEIDNAGSVRKNIGDNLKYRNNLREIESLNQDIAKLEARNATEDYERLRQEAASWALNATKLRAEQERCLGQLNAMDDQLLQMMEEYTQEYTDAASTYRESHINVETTKAAIDDLGRYSSALDKAIMQYHSLKMEELNRIAGELWQTTYQGTDIDTILIRSDNETASGKRNYNYRVCMVKQDTEMDMRGRCSAGQKVLASIIIRLALAESFGVNCGLIALDEPTTNLDRDNIRSLAESLHTIIKTRQAQSNFQLIVITHDEEFLRHMKCSDFCDNFYRVKRDDRQNSVIVRESITTVSN